MVKYRRLPLVVLSPLTGSTAFARPAHARIAPDPLRTQCPASPGTVAPPSPRPAPAVARSGPARCTSVAYTRHPLTCGTIHYALRTTHFAAYSGPRPALRGGRQLLCLKMRRESLRGRSTTSSASASAHCSRPRCVRLGLMWRRFWPPAWRTTHGSWCRDGAHVVGQGTDERQHAAGDAEERKRAARLHALCAALRQGSGEHHGQDELAGAQHARRAYKFHAPCAAFDSMLAAGVRPVLEGGALRRRCRCSRWSYAAGTGGAK